MGRAVDDPRVVQDLEVNDLDSPPVVLQALHRIAAPRAAPARAADHDGAGGRGARGHGRRRPGRARPAAALAAAAPVRRGGADDGAAVRDVAVPRRRVGGRPLPARGVRRRARRASRYPRACTGTTRRTTRWCRSGRRRAAAHRPSSSPASRGAPAGATASAATGTSTGTSGRCSPSCSRSPTPLGSPRGSAQPLPGRGGRRARRRRRRARVAGRRRRARRGEPALEATGAAAAGEVDAAPIEFPLVTAAQRAGDRDALGRPWDRGAPVDVPRRGDRPGRGRRARARARSAGWTRPAGSSEDVLRTSMLAALRGVDGPALRRGARRRGTRAGRLPLAGPLDPGASGRDAGRSSTGCAWSRDWLATQRSS